MFSTLQIAAYERRLRTHLRYTLLCYLFVAFGGLTALSLLHPPLPDGAYTPLGLLFHPLVLAGGALISVGVLLCVAAALLDRARGLKHATDVQPMLAEMLEFIASNANVRHVPALRIHTEQTRMAFALGTSLRNGAILFDRALINALPPLGLMAVLAHEFSHLYRRDPLLFKLVGGVQTFLGAIRRISAVWLIFCLVFFWMAGLPFAEVTSAFWTWVAMVLLTAAGMVLVNAASRTIEYRADLDALRLMNGNGMPLAEALFTLAPDGLPIPRLWRWLRLLWQTHPSTLDRVRRLVEHTVR